MKGFPVQGSNATASYNEKYSGNGGPFTEQYEAITLTYHAIHTATHAPIVGARGPMALLKVSLLPKTSGQGCLNNVKTARRAEKIQVDFRSGKVISSCAPKGQDQEKARLRDHSFLVQRSNSPNPQENTLARF